MKMQPHILSVILLAPLLLMQGCAPVAVTGATTAVSTVVADRRTTGTIIEDEAIENKFRLALWDRKELRKRVHVNVTSYNTWVLVTGEAPAEEDRQAVIDLVKNVEKVTRVFDEITIAAPSSLLSRSADGVVTAKIKTKLIAEQDLSTLHIKVVTENGVTFLMGLVSEEEGAIATEIARRTGGVQKVVKLFEYRESLRKRSEEEQDEDVNTGAQDE
ncbi:MAG: BON domain-containing protein [Gammaproteobacteria bacterium]|nr:BON domain-containing protein [Gammaproteobacteria bacterium]